MATENEASCQSCASDPNFAVICSFLERFAVQCGIPHPTFAELQEMIEDTEEVPQALIDLHVKLLRKARKSFSTEKWERTLIRFSHTYSSQDAWELERFGYKNARVAVKLRLLKMLLDAQFDLNMKFKTDINKLTAEELRGEPLGRDKMGYNYWCQFDPTANVRVYKEDQDEETWELVAKDREGLISLISRLSTGENIAGLEDILNEDSNSQDLEKPVIDTGQRLEEENNESCSDIKNKTEVDKEMNGVECLDALNTVNGSNVIKDEKNVNNDASKAEQLLVKIESKENNGLDTLNGFNTSSKKESSSASLHSSSTNSTEEKLPTPALEGKSEAVERENKKQISISDGSEKQDSVKDGAETGQCIVEKKSIAENNKDVIIPEVKSVPDVTVRTLSTVKQNIEIKSSVEEKPPSLNVKEFYEKSSKSNQNAKAKPSPALINSKEKPSAPVSVCPKEKSSTPAVVNSKEKPALVNSKEKTTVPPLVNSKEKLSAPAVINKKNSLCPSDNSTAVPLSLDKKNKIAPDVVPSLTSSDSNKDLSVPKLDVKEKSFPKDLIDKKPISKEVLGVKHPPVEQSTPAKPVSKELTVDVKPASKDQTADVKSSAREKPADIHIVSTDLVISKCVKKGDLDIRVISKKNLDKKSPVGNVLEADTVLRSHPDSKPALNLSINCGDPMLGAGIKDYAQSQINTILKRPVSQLNSKCVDLSSRRPAERMVPDGIKEIELRGLMKSNTAMYRDGKSAPGSKLDEIFKLKRSLNSAMNHPESQPLPAHFVGTSKNKLLEKMRMNMNESLTLVGFSESGKFTQPKNQISKPMPKDAEDLSVSKLKRGGPEDLSVSAPKKPLLDKEIVEPEVSEAIEEPVMLVKGEGSGKDCNTGNPGRDNEKLENNVKKDGSLKTDSQVKSDNTGSVSQIDTNKGDKNKCSDDSENSSVNSSSKQMLPANSLPMENNDKMECKDLSSISKESNLSEGNKCEVLAESSKVVDKKVPKLWSIDTIFSSDNMSKSSEALVSTSASEGKNVSSVGEKVSIDDGQSNNSTAELVHEQKKVDGHKDSLLVNKTTIPENNSNDLKLDNVVTVPLLDSVSDTSVKTVKESLDKSALRCVNESITVESSPSVGVETSSTSKSDKKEESQPMGFFFGPGCVKMSNVIDLGRNSEESSKIQDQQILKVEDIPKGSIDPLEILKTRKKTLDRDDVEESPHEPKKTRINTDSSFSDKEGVSKILDVDIKSKETKVIELSSKCNEKEITKPEKVFQIQSHYNNIDRNVSDKTDLDLTGTELSSVNCVLKCNTKDSMETFPVKLPVTSQPVPKECKSGAVTSISSASEGKSSGLDLKIGPFHASDLKTCIDEKSFRNENIGCKKSSEVSSVEQKNLELQDSRNKDSVQKLGCSPQLKELSDKRSIKQPISEDSISMSGREVVNSKSENEILDKAKLRERIENKPVSQQVNKNDDGNTENKYFRKILESCDSPAKEKTIDLSYKPDCSRLMKTECKGKIGKDVSSPVSKEQLSGNQEQECKVLKEEAQSKSEKTGSGIISPSSERLKENKNVLEMSNSNTVSEVKASHGKEIDGKNPTMKDASIKTASKSNDKCIDSSPSSSKLPENVEKERCSSTVVAKANNKVSFVDRGKETVEKYSRKDEPVNKIDEISKCVVKVVEKEKAIEKGIKIVKTVEKLIKEGEPLNKDEKFSKNMENVADKDKSADTGDKTVKKVEKLTENDESMNKDKKITNLVEKAQLVVKDNITNTVEKGQLLVKDNKTTNTTKKHSKIDESSDKDNKITEIERKLTVNDKTIDRDNINKITKTVEELEEKDKSTKTIEELPEMDKSINKDDRSAEAIEKHTEKDKSVNNDDKTTKVIKKPTEKDKSINKDDKTANTIEKVPEKGKSIDKAVTIKKRNEKDKLIDKNDKAATIEKLTENDKLIDKHDKAATIEKLSQKVHLVDNDNTAKIIEKLAEKDKPTDKEDKTKKAVESYAETDKSIETVKEGDNIVKNLGKLEKNEPLEQCVLLGKALMDVKEKEDKSSESIDLKAKSSAQKCDNLANEAKSEKFCGESSESSNEKLVDDTSEKNTLIGKVTIRNMSEILKPDIVSSIKKPDDKQSTEPENVSSDTKVGDNVSSDAKPVSKISLKPLSKILKPELIAAQTSLVETQTSLLKGNKNNSEKNNLKSLSTKMNDPGNQSHGDGDTIPNKLRKTAQQVVESERTTANVPIEFSNKRVHELVKKKNVKETPEINVNSKLNNVVSVRNSKSMPQNKVLENVTGTIAIPSKIPADTAIDKQSKIEQFKLETELNILAVRQELKAKRSNVPKADDEIHDFERPSVRNTRSRQKNVVLPSVKMSPKTKKQNLKTKQEAQDDDVQIILEKDPLALSDEDTSQGQKSNPDASKKEGTAEGFSLSTFSLESYPAREKQDCSLNKEGDDKIKITPKENVLSGNRKRRSSRRLASKETDDDLDPEKEKDDELEGEDEEEEEAGGKRRKVKGKRTPDVNLRRSVEAKRGRKSSTSEDEGPVPETFEGAFANFVSKKSRTTTVQAPPARGSKRNRSNKNQKSSTDVNDDSEEATPTKETEKEAKEGEKEEPKAKKKPAPRASRLEIELGINPNSIVKEDDPNESEGRSVRASRRIAQIKIREQAERRQIEEALRDDDKKINKKDKSKDKKTSLSPPSGKSHELSKNKDSKSKSNSKKSKKKDDDPPCILEIPVVDEKSKKKKKKKKLPSRAFDGRNPWASTSESSSSNEEEEEEEEHFDIEEEEEEELILKSDHEFSPESDLEKDEEYIPPLRRARTAQKDEKKDEGVEEDEGPDYPCQKCGKSDHPEWILLCDKCDNGWHASCLRPNLMLIPEGDWFCPPCQHITLILKLQESLRHYDRETKRRVNEELRRKRLAYVGISLDNVLPMATQEKSQKHTADSSSSESSSSDEGSSDDESDQSDEPVYQLRQRRQTLFSYRFNEYDDLINSAIQDELDAKGVKKSVLPEGAVVSSVKEDVETPAKENIAESVDVKTNGEEEPKETKNVDSDKKEVVEKAEEKDGDYKDEDEEDDEEEEEEIPRVVPRGRKTLVSGRKKHRRLNSLDVSSGDDDGSDEDFKGSSSEEEEEEEHDDYSDDSEGGRLRPVRRSSRTRVSRFDKEFINDDSEESDAPRRKKTRRVWQESESEESDTTWGKRKKKKSWGSSPRSRSSRRSKKKKKHGRSRHRILDSDEEVEKVPKRKKPKIKYGLDDPADDLPSRRTRGRKMNYQEVMGSDTEEEILKKTTKRIISDDEDEFKVEEELKEKKKDSDDSDSGAEAENGENEGSIINRKDEVNRNEDIEDEEDEDGDEQEDDEEDEDDDDDEDEDEDDEEDESENDDQSQDNNDLSIKEKSSVPEKVSKETLKCKIKTDSQNPNDVNKNKNDDQQLEKSSLPEDQSSVKPVVTSDKKENELPKEMPPLKMRISNQSVTSIDDTACPKTSKSVIPEEKIASSVVSVSLRQKLQLALSKKLKGVHAETKSLESENNSDDELEETSEDMLEEDLDELEEEEDEVEDIEGEEDEEDDEEEILEEGQIPKKIANQLQNVQVVLKKTDVNFGISRKDVSDESEKIETARPAAISSAAATAAASVSSTVTTAAAPPPPLPPPPLPSVPEPEKMMGIRVVSPLKLMANPPPATQPSYVRMPGAITQQPGPRPPGSIPEGATPPPKRRGRGRGKKQLAQEKAAQEQLAAERLVQEQQQLSTGGSVIRGMLQSGQPHSFPSVPRHYASQISSPRSDAGGRGVQFPTIIRGRMPFPVQQFNPNPPNRLGRPPTQIFHSSHHPLDPSPSGGGPINILSPSSKADSTSVVSSPQGKSTPPHPTYHRPPNPAGLRFPTPDSNNTRHSLPFMSSSQTSIRPPGSYPSYHHPPSNFHYPVTGYPTIIGEEALPPAAYQGSPSQFSEQYSETNPVTSDTSNSKSYDDEVSGGEFGGLVSYFSSQREDDLET